MSPLVRTWADGYGRWHAAVPEGTVNPLKVARTAIRHELLARGALGPGYRVRVVPAWGRSNVWMED